MDIILEIIFNLIIDGYNEAASDRKIPLAVRVIVAILLIAVYGGLTGFCLYQGFHDKSMLALVIGVLILLTGVSVIIQLYKKYKQRKG